LLNGPQFSRGGYLPFFDVQGVYQEKDCVLHQLYCRPLRDVLADLLLRINDLVLVALSVTSDRFSSVISIATIPA
ncbi:hypothetical protein, partial [Halococcus hamelinensis]|uniref:hypothetical protein n=1 Tax=Halococcus hamelinensis TaxID=332168 RepID=UPI0027B89897